MIGRWLIGALAVAMIVGAPGVGAQGQRPLAPPPAESGLRVAPFFDGWYQNPDGTATLSFGYSNLNREEVEIPVGPDNVVTPKEFDGRQPTAFRRECPMRPTPRPGGDASGSAACSRSRCRRASRVTSSGRCDTADRPTACPDGQRTARISSTGRWRWARCRRSCGSPRADRRAGVRRASRQAPPDGHGQLALPCRVGHRRQREGKGTGHRRGQARASPDERELVQALRSRAGRLQPFAIANGAARGHGKHDRDLQATR